MKKHHFIQNIKKFKLKSIYFNYLRSYLLIILLCVGGLFMLFGYYMITDFNNRLKHTSYQVAEKDTSLLNAQIESLRHIQYSLYTNKNINNFTDMFLDKNLFQSDLETSLSVYSTVREITTIKSQYSNINDILVYNASSDYILSTISGNYSSHFSKQLWYSFLTQDTTQMDLLCDETCLYICQKLNSGALILAVTNPFTSLTQAKDIFVFSKASNELIYGSNNTLSSPISSSNRSATTQDRSYYYVQHSSDNWFTYVYQFPIYSIFDNNNFIIIIIIVAFLLILLLVLLSFYQTHSSYKHISNILSALNVTESYPSVFAQNELQFIYNQLIYSINNAALIESELKENVEQLKKAQYIALQTQIEPHFLFNVLNMINGSIQCTVKGDCQGTKMLTLLSRHLRLSLNTQKNLITLKEELEHVHYYIELEKFMHEEQLQITYDVDVSCLNITCPRLILQPIIENSILHAMHEDKTLNITLQVQRHKNDIQIIIKDDGKGISPERLDLLKRDLSNLPENQHIGLTNVVKRMQLIYAHNFTYDIQTNIGKGTTIIFHISSNI